MRVGWKYHQCKGLIGNVTYVNVSAKKSRGRTEAPTPWNGVWLFGPVGVRVFGRPAFLAC